MSKIVATAASVVLALIAVTSVVAAPARSHEQSIKVTIMAGDHLYTGGNFALAPGVPIRVSVTNYTREFHTFTVPALGISELIRPARANAANTTTFTFTAHNWGAFAWHCQICPSGIHGRMHQMGGTLYVIVNPSALP